MNAPLRWKLIGGFLLVFIAGGVAGGLGGAVFERHHRWEAVHHGPLLQRVRDRMQSRLDLTPAQMKETDPILQKAAQRLEEVREKCGQDVLEVFAETDRAIGPYLTDAQRAKLAKLVAQRKAAAAAESKRAGE